MAQDDHVRRLRELGFEIINITEDVVVCKIDPIGPEPDDGRWIDLSINEERCLALQSVGLIIGVIVRGIDLRRTNEKPHLFIEVRRHANR